MVEPLRNRNIDDGAVYFRPEAIEAKLEELELLSRDLVLDRCQILNREDPDYIPSECILHYVRQCRRDNNEAWFEKFYAIVLERAARALPRSQNAAGTQVSAAQAEINEKVLDAFNFLLSSDRNEYSEKLDFFEIRFAAAMARLRLDAQRTVWRREKRTETIDDPETGELSEDAEKALGAYNPFENKEIELQDDRLRLDGAIDLLPPLQARIIQMLRKGIPIDSQDPNVETISKALGKSEKTIRLNRDKAFLVLRPIMKGEAE